MNLCLHQDTLIKEFDTFEECAKALKKANKSKCAEYLTFFMVGVDKPKLMSRPKLITAEFIKNPDNFIIEI